MELFSFFGSLISPITEAVKGWQERKKVKLEGDLAIQKAKTEATCKKLMTTTEGDIAWENTQINQGGWKDEYWTIILSIPCVLCFVPGMVEYVTKGFASLGQTPEWYRWMVGVSVSASFGYRKLADFMALKKGV
jgi:hypothetical protein